MTPLSESFKKTLFVFFLAAIALPLSACSVSRGRYSPNPGNPVYTVAVLPVYNATNDVEGAKAVRELFHKRMQNMHYSVRTIKEADDVLMNQMGITLGSQLEMTSPKQLGEILGVDGVVYGYLLNFENVTTGVYNVKKVRAGFKLVDARTGQVVWAKGGGVKSGVAGGDVGAGITIVREAMDAREGLDAFKSVKGIDDIPGLKDWDILYAGKDNVKEAAVFSIGEKLVTKALGVHMRLETDKMLDGVFKSFPAGPGSPRPAPALPSASNGSGAAPGSDAKTAVRKR